MGRAMDSYADVHERAWHFLASLGADIALVQETIPPDWIRERFQVHAVPTQVPWTTAVIVREDWPMRLVTPTPVIAGFAWYVCTVEVAVPDGMNLLVGRVHATASSWTRCGSRPPTVTPSRPSTT